MPSSEIDAPWHVLVHIKLDNEWNEWAMIGGFSFLMPSITSPYIAARHAARIVDHKGEQIVRVEVYNPATKLYDQEFRIEPLKF